MQVPFGMRPSPADAFEVRLDVKLGPRHAHATPSDRSLEGRVQGGIDGFEPYPSGVTRWMDVEQVALGRGDQQETPYAQTDATHTRKRRIVKDGEVNKGWTARSGQ